MKKVRLAACAVALTVGGLTPLGLSPAAADPASAAGALGYGANLDLAGTPVVDQGGLATAALPPGQDDTGTLVLVPAPPLAVSGTANGVANAHAASDIPTALVDVTQGVPGPYNARGVGQVEGLQILSGLPPAVTVSLLSATAVTGEAVGVCRNGVAQYSGATEIVNLQVGGTTVPLNTTVGGLIDLVDNLVQPLTQIVDIQRNEVTVTPTGVVVNALHVTVLGAVGGVAIPNAAPLLDLKVGHAEVGGLQCPPVPQCSDTQDNDGDGVIDAQDPGCITNGVYDPNDNDERNECVDGIDNADPEDSLVDFGRDPGCESAQDDDETDPPGGPELPRTGGVTSTTVPMAGGFVLMALAALTLRRRSQASK